MLKGNRKLDLMKREGLVEILVEVLLVGAKIGVKVAVRWECEAVWGEGGRLPGRRSSASLTAELNDNERQASISTLFNS